MRETPGLYHALITTEENHPDKVRALLTLRKKLFVDQCGWALTTVGDVERDEFDSADTEHCMLFDEGELVGGFRAIRTDRAYLTHSVFPQLASSRPLPQRHDVWEISRFGVLPARRATAARLNYALMFRFAELRGAIALVAMADLLYERFLDRMSIQTKRFGPPQVIGRDVSGRFLTAVAGEIPLSRSQNPNLQSFLDLSQNLDIHDAAHVLGRSTFPARSALVFT